MTQVQTIFLIFSIPTAIGSIIYIIFNRKRQKESQADKQYRERKESIIWYYIYNYFWAKYPVIVALVVAVVIMTIIIQVVF